MTQFLSWEFELVEVAYSWLRTVAIREAVKLDRRARRTSPLVTEHDEFIDVVDPRDQLQLTRLLTEAGDVVKAAGLSPRQTHILGLQVLGLSYDETPRRSSGRRRRSLQRAPPRIAVLDLIEDYESPGLARVPQSTGCAGRGTKPNRQTAGSCVVSACNAFCER